jgi:hypothetical protein
MGGVGKKKIKLVSSQNMSTSILVGDDSHAIFPDKRLQAREHIEPVNRPQRPGWTKKNCVSLFAPLLSIKVLI